MQPNSTVTVLGGPCLVLLLQVLSDLARHAGAAAAQQRPLTLTAVFRSTVAAYPSAARLHNRLPEPRRITALQDAAAVYLLREWSKWEDSAATLDLVDVLLASGVPTSRVSGSALTFSCAIWAVLCQTHTQTHTETHQQPPVCSCVLSSNYVCQRVDAAALCHCCADIC